MNPPSDCRHCEVVIYRFNEYDPQGRCDIEQTLVNADAHRCRHHMKGIGYGGIFFIGTKGTSTSDICDIVGVTCAVGTANYSEVCPDM